MTSRDFRAFLRNVKRKNAVILLALSVGLVYILFDSRGLIQRIRLESEKSTLEKRIRDLQEEDRSIESEIEKLKISDQEIERVAREKYFMHRNGEKIIKVQPN